MGSIKTIFLTGATGYLGSNLLHALVTQGYQVTILKRTTSRLDRIATLIDKITLLNVEEVDIDAHFSAHQYDAVVHTAASYGRSGNSLEAVLMPNLFLPLKILNAAIASGVRYFINTDTALPKNINSYALSKKQFVEWLQFSVDSITTINIELQYFFGAGDDNWKFINSIVSKFLSKAESMDFTTAEQLRDFIYIDDAVAAYLVLLQNAEQFSLFNRVELGSGQAVALKDIIIKLQQIGEATDTKLNFGAIPMRANEVMFSQASTTVLESFGWKPMYSLEEGLTKTIENERYSYANTER